MIYNMGGSRCSHRRAVAIIVQSILVNGTPVWMEMLTRVMNQKRVSLIGPCRRISDEEFCIATDVLANEPQSECEGEVFHLI